MFEKVLVAIDDSPYADTALEAVEKIAVETKGSVRIVHVREVLGPVPAIESREEAASFLSEAITRLDDHGIDVSGSVREARVGRVASEVLAEAHEWEAEVIVVASRGLTDLSGLLLGSTTHKILHLSDLPVLVLR
jgi:nucleotide-binding universal stress UspA family protein